MGDFSPELRSQESTIGLGTRGRVALGAFAAAAAYFLWTEHRAHVIEFLPWGILALCPLAHLFMHRGHGSHGSDDTDADGGGKGREGDPHLDPFRISEAARDFGSAYRNYASRTPRWVPAWRGIARVRGPV